MTERVKQIKPRHVFGTLVLIAEAPILGAFVAGWLISGLMYVAAIGVERASGHGSNWRTSHDARRPAQTVPSCASRPSSRASRGPQAVEGHTPRQQQRRAPVRRSRNMVGVCASRGPHPSSAA